METAVKNAAKPATAREKTKTATNRQRTQAQQQRAVADILRTSRCIQTKLRIGQPNDQFEKEADRIADQFVNHAVTADESSVQAVAPVIENDISAGKSQVQRACSQCEEELQRKPDEEDQEMRDEANLELAWASELLSEGSFGGRPLENRGFFEAGLGSGFGRVRVHTDRRADHMAAKLGARAFTLGSNIYFADGEYQPYSRPGKLLIVHELVHTLQQQGSRLLIQRACGDAGCAAADPDTPDCPDPEDFLLDPTLENVRQSVFDGPGRLQIVERGDSGAAVELIQRLLLNANCSGFDRANVRGEMTTQTFGRYTDAAVEQFQRSHTDANGEPLVVDGDVGPATLSAMDVILQLDSVNPAADPEEVGQCYGEAEEGPGEARAVPATEVLPLFPFFPAFKSWELQNFDIDASFVKTEHRRFIRDTILPAVRDAEADFPDAAGMHIRLVGEASTTASDTYNLGLSARRTHCVRETLIDEGIRAEDILDHSASALGERIAQLRRAAAGLPVDNVEDRKARKVTVILDLSADENGDEDCGDADKTLASTAYRAKIACAGSMAMRVNIGNFGNPGQPVFREFIWQQQLPTLDGCFFRLDNLPDEFIPVRTPEEIQLAATNPTATGSHSDFQGVVLLMSDSGGNALRKASTTALPAYLIGLRGDWSNAGCLPDHEAVPGVMRPIGPVKCGVVPAPPVSENCYPSDTEEDCPDEVRQAAAREYVATMVRISGDPVEAIKQIKRIAKFAAVLEWVLDFFGIEALLGGGAIVIGSQDLDQPILRPFLFLGGGIGGAAEAPIGGNLLVSRPFTLEIPKQLETDEAGLLLNGSDFSGWASITIIGGTNREELTINGDGFSKTVPMWGLPCDGGATRTARGRLFSVANARCLALEALPPPPERECEDECSENLRLSGFEDFTIKVGRASYSALPGMAQRIADTMGGCGATMAFINVGTRSEDEDDTTVFRKFAFVGLNTNCAFTVVRGSEDRSYTLERQLAHGDANDRFSLSDFAGTATVDTGGLLSIIDLPLTQFNLPGTYAAECEGGSINGMLIPISPVECGNIPAPPHITVPDPTDVDRCNRFKADNAVIVDFHVEKLRSGDYNDVLDTISSGPTLRYPEYRTLFLQIGDTVPNAVFVGKTIANEPVVTFIDMEILRGERLPSGAYVFHINVLKKPCSFNARGEPVLLLPDNCREGMIDTGQGIIFPVFQRPAQNPGEDVEPAGDVDEANIAGGRLG
ncbi:OmpA family protein [Nitrosomonas marina]|uniref:OmpA family protein n=1 Tax=Nitrosomonas marina TaxID=917 RepID=A0A1H8ANQ5_9PROT|nr:OmpA family protein [Nitrosomonas marina]